MILAAIGCIWAVVWLLLADEGTLDSGAANGPAANPPAQPYARLLIDRSVLGCAVTHFAGYWSMALALTWLPAYFERGLGYDGVVSGWLYSLVIVVTVPFGVGLALGSERLLRRGVSSRTARGRYLSGLLAMSGLLLTPVYLGPSHDWIRIALIATALGCTPIVFSAGPAIIAEVVPVSQRGAMLAINNSVASLAGIAAPVVTGTLIQDIAGARGFEIGFALCGGLMVLCGLFGFFAIDPESSQRASAEAAAVRA